MRSHVARRIPYLAAVLSFAVLPFAAGAKDEPAVAPGDSPSAAQPVDQPGAAEREKKDQLATAAVFLFVLVMIACGGLLIGVLLWGRRVRRVARTRTPPVSAGDELWYLRPSKTRAAPTPRPENRPPEEADPNEPGA